MEFRGSAYVVNFFLFHYYRQMKKLSLIGVTAAFTACAAVVCSCNSNAKDELAHHHHDHHEHEARAHTGNEIVLEPEQAEMLGVKATQVKPVTFHKVLKVSGQVLESAAGAGMASAPAAGTIIFAPGIGEGSRVSAGMVIARVRQGNTTGGDPNAAARANLEAAKRELDRITPLHEHGIVSTAEYNAAIAAYNAAKAMYSPGASAGAVVAPVAGVITSLKARSGEFVEAGAPVAAVSSGNSLTLRADVPQRHYGALANITGAKIRTPYSTDVIDLADLGAARRQGAAPSSERPGYVPVYFVFDNNGSVVPGTPVEVFLQGNPREGVIALPVSAVSEQQGRYFVFRKVDEECYEKIPVTLGDSDGDMVEITNGVKAGDNIVTAGAVSVRLAESSGVVPEGHSHNH